MIIITQPNATEEQIERVVERVREFGLEARPRCLVLTVVLALEQAERFLCA